MIKCIECEYEAEYIYDGRSLCKAHLDYYLDDGKTYEAEYYTLLKEYQGTERTLNYLWNQIARQYRLTYKSKCNWLTNINREVKSSGITKQIIDDAINIVVRKRQFYIGTMIKIMQTNQSTLNRKLETKNNNDELFQQIAKQAWE